MGNAEWGLSADEGRAIIADAGGEVMVRDTNSHHRAVRSGKLLEVTNRTGKVHGGGKGGEWYSLDQFKPSGPKAREVVAAMRAKREAKPAAKETKPEKETMTMPPDFAPRPQAKTVPVPVPAQAPSAPVPGAITIAASKIETALRTAEEKRKDVRAAQVEYDAAKSMLDDAVAAVETAEAEARRLAVELNKLIGVG